MSGMPELGSKISLISKADIRYEGRLFTVDPTECTIALANVRSFGTEDRDTSYPIMPQPTIYDYILFRGSDIKDIRVVNSVPTIPNDPAIMQMHLPPQQNFPPQNFPPMQQPQQPGQFGGPFGGMGVGPSMGGNMPPQPQPQQQQQAQSPVQQQQGNNNNNLAPGSGQKNKRSNSRSGTPQNAARKSPTSEMAIQTNQGPRENQQGGSKDKPHRINQRNNNNQNNNNNNQQRERRDSGRNENQENNRQGGYRNQNPRQNNQVGNNQHHNQNRGGYNNNNNMNRGQPNRGNQGGQMRMRGPNFPTFQQQNYRPQNNHQGPPNKPNPNGPQQRNPGGNKLKFDNEFDFEQANSKFEELRSQLAKMKVGTEPTEAKPTEQVNGEVEKKDDSGNETGADPEGESEEAGYDKTKSFFDNISCEAVERSKGKTQRTDWRQERKINSETFGYSSHRRVNYRGRGGHYGNQYNRGPRGGYRGGNYRPVRNHRNQNNAEGRNNNNQQQSQNQAAPVAAN